MTLGMPAARRIEEYRSILAAKAQLAPVSGLDIDPDLVHPMRPPSLYPVRAVARSSAMPRYRAAPPRMR